MLHLACTLYLMTPTIVNTATIPIATPNPVAKFKKGLASFGALVEGTYAGLILVSGAVKK